MLTFHRFAETEDPFGSENAENWWKEWFDEERPLQPTAIINGGDSLIGATKEVMTIFTLRRQKQI